MDKSWMVKDRRSNEYVDGVKQFLHFAVIHASNLDSIRSPCLACGNLRFQPIQEIKNHLFFKGIDQSYITWIWHGESINSGVCTGNAESFYDEEDDTHFVDDAVDAVDMVEAACDECTSDPSLFKKLIEDAEKPLYPDCTKFTKLSALVRLFNFKARSGLSNTSFSTLLTLLGEMLPSHNEIPSSFYEARKTMAALGMGYEKIHASSYDCILYRKEFKDVTSCPTCKTSRWKLKSNSTEIREGVPAKVVWYFPIIPRFQKWFHLAKTAKDLTWHAQPRDSDGQLRHPADSPSWKLVDYMWPDFAAEPRNLRLAISADGINPHSTLSSRYSCWLVITVTYNLPPWLCMKRKFMMLSLLISGPQQPGNDIDVFLAPLIDDLKLLWEVGVEAYDAYKQESFTLKAVLLWTVNDFPAYGNLSGCTVKGYFACPICGEGTTSTRLKHNRKNVYMAHRKFLPRYHPYRREKKAFNGEQEFGLAPQPLSGEQVFQKVEGIKIIWGKKIKSPPSGSNCWKKKSIFFDLEYWKSLHVRHILDVMHIEKNVCESVIGTLLHIKGKMKDGTNARLDLVEMGIRLELAPEIGEKRTLLPATCHTLSKVEKGKVCRTLLELKVPEGYSSNFRSHVSMQDLKLYGLKSHDCHVLMQQLLPVAIRDVLPKHARYAITRLCFFFRAICSKVVDVAKLDEIQADLVTTLCMLEKYFLPSFFDIMIHLTVHLVREVRLCGPVWYRWMFQFERFMKVLKGYVKNRKCPEGCIAESYIVEEAIEFCTEFLSDVDAIGIPSARNMIGDDCHDSEGGRPFPGGRVVIAAREELAQAHLCILENANEVLPYIEEHMAFLKQLYPRKSNDQKWLQIEHRKRFNNWLKEKFEVELEVDNNISDSLKWMAQGPCLEVIKYPGYIINGCRYHTKDRDNDRVSQNSGVKLVAMTMQVSGYKDNKPVFADMSYYGVITEIWHIDYHTFKTAVFKCDWVESKRGVKVDELGFTLVQLGRKGHRSDSFILASHAKQIFYVRDQVDPNWWVVLEPPRRHYPSDGDDDLNDCCIEHHDSSNMPEVGSFDVTDDSMPCYIRPDGEGILEDNT